MPERKDRDQKLFEIFVRENEGALMAYIRAFTRDAALAEDLFQETMLTAWQRIDDFDPQRSLASWLRGIALNVLRNSWRKQSSDKLVFDESTAEIAESALAVIENQSGDTWQERLSALSDCVSQLPPRSRELIHESYTKQRPADELSTLLGLSSAAIRKRLQRIREQLARCIGHRLGEALG